MVPVNPGSDSFIQKLSQLGHNVGQFVNEKSKAARAKFNLIIKELFKISDVPQSNVPSLKGRNMTPFTQNNISKEFSKGGLSVNQLEKKGMNSVMKKIGCTVPYRI